MKINTKLLNLFVGLCLLGLSTTSQADSLTQTVALPSISDGFGFSDGDMDSYFSIVSIGGLNKFDPAMGMLTGISMAINAGDFSSSLEIQANENGNGAFDVNFSASFFDFEVVYNTVENGSNFGKVLSTYDLTTDISCGGSMGDGGCGTGFDDTGPWQDMSDFTDQANFSDFIGTGPLVDVFEIYWVAYEYSVTGQNITDGTGSASIDLAAGDVNFDTNTFELTYEFTPVPLPASWLLVAPALGFLARRKNMWSGSISTAK